MQAKRLLPLLLMFMVIGLKAQEFELKKNWWLPNNSVEDIIKDSINNQIILAGDFTRLAQPHKHNIATDLRSNQIHYSFPQTDETVYTSISDGEGGWFIGGDFSMVGDSNRMRLAHLNRYGQVTARLSHLNLDDQVLALERRNGSLYVGGAFERAGELRPYGAAVDKNNGLTKTEYPSPDRGVLVSIEDGNGGFYIGGYFDKVGDSSRSKIAHILSDGSVGPPVVLNAEMTGTIYDMVIHDSIMYIVGNYETTTGVYRRNIAAIHLAKHEFTDWEVEVNGRIEAVTTTDSMVYFGGSFDSVRNEVRLNFSAMKHSDDNSNPLFSHITGVIINVFGATAPGYVHTLKARDSLIYIGGDFNIVKGVDRANFATFNIDNGNIGAGNVDVNSDVYSIEPVDSLVYIGGEFTEINSLERKNIAALHAINFNLQPLSIDIDDDVLDLHLEDSILYFVGRFEEVEALERNRVAAYNLNAETITDWNPDADFPVYTVGSNSDAIYLGGFMRYVGGLKRNRLLIVDLSTDSLTNASFDYEHNITAIVSNDSVLYVVEDSMRGLNYSFINKIRLSSLQPSRIGLNPNREVRTLHLKDSLLYLGGYFTNIGGKNRSRLAEYNIVADSVTSLAISISGGVETINSRNNSLMLGGSIFSIEGNTQYYFAEVDLTGDTATSWNLNFRRKFNVGRIHDIQFTDSTMIVAGRFDSLLNVGRQNVAEIRLSDTSITDLNPAPNEIVHTIAINEFGSHLQIGGEFSGAGGVERNFIAAIDPSTGQPTDWKPVVDSRTYGLAMKDSILVIAGNFYQVMDSSRRYFAALNVKTLEVEPMNPTFSSFISDYLFVGDTLFVAGAFTTIDANAQRYIAAFDWTTKSLLPWNPRPSSNVWELTADEDHLYAIGNFSSVGSFPSTVSRDRLAEFSLSTLNITNWSPSVDGFVYEVEVNDSAIYLGGSFSEIDNVDREHFAAIDKHTKAISPLELNVNNTVFHISPFDSTLFIAGNFTNIYTTINNRFNDRLAQLDQNNNAITDFRADLDRNPGIVLQVDSNLLVGGYFFEVAGEKQPHLAAFGAACSSESSIDTILACGSYTWIDFFTYTESTTVPKIKLVNRRGCDSIVSLHLTIFQPFDTTYTINQCDPYVWPANGQLYSLSGTYHDTLIDSKGCDSILSLNLTVNNNSAIDAITACDSITWINGITYTASTNSVYDTLTNALGCDSVVQLNLTINETKTYTDSLISCDSLTWINGITYYASTDTPKDTLLSSQNCDSIVSLNLTVYPSFQTIDSLTACDSLSWIDGITYYNSTSSPSFVMTSANGCDSTVSLHLTVYRSTNDTIRVNTCDEYLWDLNNENYINSGMYTDTIATTNGCDSVVTLDLNIQNNSSTDFQTVCDSLTWIDGITYRSSTNSPKDTLSNQFGCDSVVTLNLIVNNSANSIDSIVACDSLVWMDGVTYTSNTNRPTFVMNTVDGCDSTITLHLTVNTSSIDTLNITSCSEYNWSQTGIVYDREGFYSDTLTRGNGCDSITVLNLVLQESFTSEIITACDSFAWTDGNTYFNSTNTPRDTFINRFSCDSIVSLNLTITSSTEFIDSIATCDSVSWIDGNTYYSSTTSPFVKLVNQEGCDSIVRLNLEVLDFVDTLRFSGDSLFAAQSGSAYQWLNCDSSFKVIPGATNSYFVPLISGNYACEVTTKACVDTSLCYSKIVTGIEKLTAEQIRIFPNPATNELFFQGFKAGNTVVIYNAEGKMLKQISIENPVLQKIEISNWAKGIYWIKSDINNKSFSQKLLIH